MYQSLSFPTSVKTFVPDECGQKSASGNFLSMHYTGRIDESSETGEKMKKFDSSLDRDQPFNFKLGGGQVIKGWDQGLNDMCIGEKRTLIIGPDMGYGSRGAGSVIPGGATLNFEVELLEINDSEPVQEVPNIFAQLDKDGDGFVIEEELNAWFKEVQGLDTPPGDVFNHEDKNKDGKISWEEFSGPKGEKPEDKDEL
mmetsp:Transcript_8170/g.11581  ORF Transcript_8170/g.11581 Transcript_8170/m.11581 type:complete len:198 (-) Transcript_8170:8-601(-)